MPKACAARAPQGAVHRRQPQHQGGRKITEFKKKALTAVERCLEHRGYALIKSSPTLKDGGYTDIVANDGNSIVFVEVIAKDGAARAFPRNSTALLTRYVRPSKGPEATAAERACFRALADRRRDAGDQRRAGKVGPARVRRPQGALND